MCRKRWCVSQLERLHSLEIDEDLVFERRQWVVQRAGWLVMLLILLAGLAGLLGSGPLNNVQASTGALDVEFERVIRTFAPSEVRVRLAPGAAQDGEVALLLSQDFLDMVDVTQVVPEPSEMEATAAGTVLRFAVASPEQPAEVTFTIEPAEPGLARGHLGLLHGESLAIDQTIVP
jgi:hypothetical protein